jgi:hypothetical protein
MHEQLRPGDPILVDGTRALRLRIPGPPIPGSADGPRWLPGTVVRVRDDGWLVVELAADAVHHALGTRVVAPPEAVRPG